MLSHADVRAWCAKWGYPWPIPDMDPQPEAGAKVPAEIERLRQALAEAQSKLLSLEQDRDGWKAAAEHIPDTSASSGRNDELDEVLADNARLQSEVTRLSERLVGKGREIELLERTIARNAVTSAALLDAVESRLSEALREIERLSATHLAQGPEVLTERSIRDELAASVDAYIPIALVVRALSTSEGDVPAVIARWLIQSGAYNSQVDFAINYRTGEIEPNVEYAKEVLEEIARGLDPETCLNDVEEMPTWGRRDISTTLERLGRKVDLPSYQDPHLLAHGPGQGRIEVATGDGSALLIAATNDRVGKAKLTDEQRAEIVQRAKNGETHQKLAEEFGVTRQYVSKLCDGMRSQRASPFPSVATVRK